MKNLIAQLQTWWSSISQREQYLVIACSALVGLGVIYWGMIQPVAQRAEAAQMRIHSEKQLLNWVQNKADDIVQLRGKGGIRPSSQPLNQVIATSARRYKVELIRVQPRGEMLQVWVKEMPFNQFVDWLRHLKETQGIDVEFMDIDRGERPGVVEINRLQFKRG